MKGSRLVGSILRGVLAVLILALMMWVESP